MDFAETPVGLIGVLGLDHVQGDQITYVVTPAEAKAIQDLVDRYAAASNRRIWKLGSNLSAEHLVELYATPQPAPTIDDLFAEPQDVPETNGGS